MYWDIVLYETLNRKFLRHFAFTNFCEIKSTSNKVEDETNIYKRENKIYPLGKNFPNTHLSKREAECIVHMLRGKSLKGIGQALNLSPRTIEFYVKNIKKKLGCRTKFELIDIILASEFLQNIEL